MKLKFYGTRGSIPVCDAGFQQFGGNTTCLQITFPIRAASPLLTPERDCEIWAGTCAPSATNRRQIVIAFTHFHWDHMQGFPFFAPAYNPRQKITLLTLGRDQTVGNLREIFEVQMQARIFPCAVGSDGGPISNL